MSQVLRLTCPGCSNTLRIPPQWVGQALRCKHCKLLIQSKKRLKTAAAAVTAPVALTLPSEPITPEPFDSPSLAPPTDDEHSEGEYTRLKKKGNTTALVTMSLLCLLGVGIIGVAGAVAAGYIPLNRLQSLIGFGGAVASSKSTGTEKDSADDLKVNGNGDVVGVTGDFPRRILAVSVSNYLYANPVSYGALDAKDETKGRSIHALMNRLARVLHVPESQICELSDAGPLRMARPPLKAVIESTVGEFLRASRPQDRVMLLFVGHAVEIENTVYLVPLEGELTNKDTLLPLAWLYEQLDKCPARQKLLIADFCRYDPNRGVERPGTGNMSEAVDKALANPPDGVQVWSSCTAGQMSFEYENSYGLISGGVFLNSIYEAIGPDARKRAQLGLQRPGDPLPLDALIKTVNRVTEEEVQDYQKLKQTPRVVGKEKANGAPYNPQEPLPPKVEPKLPPAPEGGYVALAPLRTILEETENKLPTKRFGDTASHLRAETLPPFSAKVLADYLDEDAKGEVSPLRKAVVDATEKLINSQKEKNDFMDEIRNNTPEVKKQILKDQRKPAVIRLELEDAMQALEEAAGKRKEEKSKRWLANYDYILARVAARMAYIDEYNLMLGKIRKDELPTLGPKDKGWRISSREKPNTKEAKDLATKAKKALDRLVTEHAGTPWEVLGKRERLTALGLEWQATSFAE